MKEIKDEVLVKIESLTSGIIGINLPDQRVKRDWERKGALKTIKMGVLKEAIYDPGVEYMLKEGILNIKDSGGFTSLEIKQVLGLEPEYAEEPENIIILTDAQKTKLLKIDPVSKLRELIKTLPYEQILDLADYAIEKEIVDMEKNRVIEKACDINILKAIELKRASLEEEEEK